MYPNNVQYYSSHSAPQISNAKKEIENYLYRFSSKLAEKSNFITEQECNDIINRIFIKYIRDDLLIYTWTGWYAIGQNAVKKEIIYEICEFIKIKCRRKVRGLLRALYFLMKCYRKTKEKLYHPDSDYVRNIIKADFETLKIKLNTL